MEFMDWYMSSYWMLVISYCSFEIAYGILDLCTNGIRVKWLYG